MMFEQLTRDENSQLYTRLVAATGAFHREAFLLDHTDMRPGWTWDSPGDPGWFAYDAASGEMIELREDLTRALEHTDA